jgi:hypothetical protein
MLQRLAIHPSSPCPGVATIEARAARPGPGLLVLGYALTGAVEGLYLPAVTAPARTDELWKRTCFEAFVLPAPGDAYAEFNIAPSTRWAAYRFDRYREGMRDAGEIAPLDVVAQTAEAGFSLRVSFDLTVLPDFDCAAPWRLGLSAVIEAADGALSYWALAHPSPRPDFHNAAGFTLEIPPPERP